MLENVTHIPSNTIRIVLVVNKTLTFSIVMLPTGYPHGYEYEPT